MISRRTFLSHSTSVFLATQPANSEKKQATMILDTLSRVEQGPKAPERSLWDGILMQ